MNLVGAALTLWWQATILVLLLTTESMVEGFHRKHSLSNITDEEFAMRRLLKTYGYSNSMEGIKIGDYMDVLPTLIERFQRQYNLDVTGKLDGTTLRLLNAPMCGNEPMKPFEDITKPGDLKRGKRSVPQLKWPNNTLTWRIDVYTTKLIQALQHDAVSRAFGEWSKAANLTFVEIYDRREPVHIALSFVERDHGDGYPFDGEGRILAHAYYPDPKGKVSTIDGDVHIDDDEDWDSEDGLSDFYGVVLHEIGHSLGLSHSTNSRAIMYPAYGFQMGGSHVANSDRDELQKLYGEPPSWREPLTTPIQTEPTTKMTEPPVDTTRSPHRPGRIPERTTPYEPKGPTTQTPEPDYCTAEIDEVISFGRREYFIFQKERMWRTLGWRQYDGSYKHELNGYLADFHRFWTAMPTSVDHIDAGIRLGRRIYIFSGTKFWILENNSRLAAGIPMSGLPLFDLQLPNYVTKVDTIFEWPENRTVYLTAGPFYWEFDANTGRFGSVISGNKYPRYIDEGWPGAPYSVQAVLTRLNGKTLFIKGRIYYEFDTRAKRFGAPHSARLGELGCQQI